MSGPHRRGGVAFMAAVVVIAFGPGVGVGGRHPLHTRPQGDPQRGPLVLVHHREVELDLVDTGRSQRHPMHLVSQLVGTGPRRHGERQFDAHPAPPRRHIAHHPEDPKGQSELGFDDGIECCDKL